MLFLKLQNQRICQVQLKCKPSLRLPVIFQILQIEVLGDKILFSLCLEVRLVRAVGLLPGLLGKVKDLFLPITILAELRSRKKVDL